MNNEQQKAKELAELLTAFAEGKEFLLNSVTGWIDFKFESVAELNMYFFDPQNNIRIKPEPKRMPLTQQDLIDRELIKDTMRLKHINSDANYIIPRFNYDCVIIDCGCGDDAYSYDDLAKCFAFLDGNPCSKEVEGE